MFIINNRKWCSVIKSIFIVALFAMIIKAERVAVIEDVVASW